MTQEGRIQLGRDLLHRLFQVVLLGYLLGVTAFHRDFSRLSVTVAGIPLFVGELTIAVLLLLACAIVLRTRRLPLVPGIAEWGVVVYLAIGVAFLGIGLANGYGLAAARDAALVYYALFYVFLLLFLAFGGTARTIVDVLALGAVLGSLVVDARFLMRPELDWGHAAPSYQSLIAWAGVLLLAYKVGVTQGRLGRLILGAGIAVCALSVFLSAYRTLAGVMPASLALVWIGGWRRSRGGNRNLLHGAGIATLAFAGIALLVAILVWFVPGSGAPIQQNGEVSREEGIRSVAARWAGLAGYTEIEGSLSFRRDAWKLAIMRIREQPLVGIGYGPPAALYPDSQCKIASSPTSNCGNAHNTFLTLAMRMGVPVLTYFAALNGVVVLRLWRTLLARKWSTPWVDPALLTSAILAGFAVYGFMSLLLESPYLSSVYWIILALLGHWAEQGIERRISLRGGGLSVEA